ncbi:FAD-binding protein [Actinomadura sp. LD22]|uniref:FAD-binding protein n=1 Tax=Actinomadura physcomitrii TaxID=2650748 RepID=A0A6I4M6L1_9ACTN|nr:FAD-binding protein [Actinomadura physcomitrii]MVZ99796.1 FAD-binding protein [Actinomadura physcomitrii]
MGPSGLVDVVVIGSGMSGLASAVVSAKAGARVLLLDQDVPVRRRLVSSRADRSREALRAGLWRAVHSVGVQVQVHCRAHELVMDGGKVTGVGYAMLPSRGVASTGYRLLRRMNARLPERFGSVLDRAADSVWRSSFDVGEVGCLRVVLAMDPRHWEFVGPAAWAVARGLGDGAQARPENLRRLRAIDPAAGGGRTPELAVREWCASRDAAASASLLEELSVDETTGAVVVREGWRVRGLYTAAHVDDAEVIHSFAPAALSGDGSELRRAA